MAAVLVLGEDNHNTLGVVRNLGKKNINVYGVLKSEVGRATFVDKSKYWKKIWFVQDERELFEIYEEIAKVINEEIVFISCSDGFSYEVDCNLSFFGEECHISSFRGEPGKLAQLMNKDEQVKYTRKLGFMMLEETVVSLTEQRIDEKWNGPVILKPVESHEGNKLDIKICMNVHEYSESILRLKNKGYQRILKQKYLDEKEEFVVTGSLFGNSFAFSILKNIRQWPQGIGTGSFATFFTEETLVLYVKQLLSAVLESGYRGPIDIELFRNPQGDIYINEINWRCGGRNYTDFFTGIDACYHWYLSNISSDDTSDLGTQIISVKSGYTMNEWTDMRHIIRKNISLYKWFIDVYKTNIFANWFIGDLKPVCYRIWNILVNK